MVKEVSQYEENGWWVISWNSSSSFSYWNIFFCFREMFWRRMERNVNLLPLHYTALSTMQIVRGLVPRIWCSSPWKNIMRSIQIDITLDAQLTCYVVIESPLNCVYFILKRLQNSNSKQKDSRKSHIYNLYINLYKPIKTYWRRHYFTVS